MRATVLEVRVNGLILRIENAADVAEEAWLPSSEWSSRSLEWSLAMLSLESGDELDVVSLNRPIEGRVAVSRKGFTLASIDQGWTNNIRELRVDDVGKTLIRGTIGDGIRAVVDRQSYLDWIGSKKLTQDLSDHSVLGRGDMIRGFVTFVPGRPDPIEVDTREYLEVRSLEIADAVGKTIEPAAKNREEPDSPSTQLEREMVEAISPVLLADDNDSCRNSIAALLRRNGVEVLTLENTAEARGFLASLSSGTPYLQPSKPFRMAILDPNLEVDSSDNAGLEVAEALRREADCRVILMTGEVETKNKLDNWPDLTVHGYIEKAFTMEYLVEALREACDLNEARPLEDWVTLEGEQSSSVGELESPISAYDPGEVSMEQALQTLGNQRIGAVIHVFQLHPRSFRARSLASSGTGLKWEMLRGKIAKSVIRDTAFGERLVLEANAGQHLPAHLWTLRMMKYRSFCGVPVHVKGRRLALVAFHPEPSAFDDAFVAAARLAAEQVGRAVERKALSDSRGNEARHASSGMALASLAHELASDLTALDANLGILEQDTSSGATALPSIDAPVTLKTIRKHVAEISEKTRTLRGVRARSGRVSIIDCLRKAASACRIVTAETINQPDRILIELVTAPQGSWEVAAPASSLIIVFFNLYLNAAQQIHLASGVRRYGTIWNSIERFDDANGKAWAKVRIHDTGLGIHRDDWERVFEPGYSTKPDGSGLGLYICRQVLRDIAATVSITSSVIWDGTTVTVNIPLASAIREAESK